MRDHVPSEQDYTTSTRYTDKLCISRTHPTSDSTWNSQNDTSQQSSKVAPVLVTTVPQLSVTAVPLPPATPYPTAFHGHITVPCDRKHDVHYATTRKTYVPVTGAFRFDASSASRYICSTVNPSTAETYI